MRTFYFKYIGDRPGRRSKKKSRGSSFLAAVANLIVEQTKAGKPRIVANRFGQCQKAR